MTHAALYPPSSRDAADRGLCYELGRSRLVGSVRVSGAKNSVLRLMAASLLSPGRIVLHNYPSDLRDAQIHLGMLQALGKNCALQDDTLTITETAPPAPRLEWHDRSIRNTLLILGALTARVGAGAVPLPGGCDIGKSGDRRFDLHVLVLESLGARVWSEGRTLLAEAPQGLTAADIHLPIRSTGATENAILCGALAHGVTRIWNPHIRPEIVDMIAFLRTLGAQIRIFGQEHIEVTGVDGLGGAEHRIMPDNVEALTWLVGAMITGGEIEICDFPHAHLEVPLIFLRESGARLFCGENALVVRGGRCYPVDIATGPYPGINSDMQPLFAVYGAAARGESRLIDLRFPGRYAYAEELARLGIQHRMDGNLLRILGGVPLRGADVRALDLRAGIALCLAALMADGATTVHDAWQIERGYSNFAPKLRALGGTLVVR
jgi:UDP-N-acetylglucosamine 1-carboxyvinyltransferase